MSQRIALVAVLLCLTPVVGWGDEEETDPFRGPVTAVLAEVHEDPPDVDTEIVKRLRAFPPEALPTLLDVYADLPPGGSRARTLAAAILEDDVGALHRAFRVLVRAEPGLEPRLRILRALGRLMDHDGLPVAVEIVAGIEPLHLAHQRVAGAWRTALHGLLADGATKRSIARAVVRVPRALHAPTARVLAEVGRPETLSVLLDLLLDRPDNPEALLRDLSRASPLALAAVETERVLHHYLTRGDARARAAAADAVAWIGSHDLMPELIALLDTPDVRGRRAARGALRSLTGTRAGPTAKAWRTWLDTEEAWFERSKLQVRLESAAPGPLSFALREVSMHPYAALPALPQITVLLRHANPGVRLGAVTALRALRKPESARALVALLRDSVSTVRAAAHQALLAITRERLPLHAAAWEQLLEDRT